MTEHSVDSGGKGDWRFLAGAAIAIVVLAAAVLLALRAVGLLGSSHQQAIAAALTFVGVVITACVSVLGLTIKRQGERRLAREGQENDARLRLDAAMRAGALFNDDERPGAPAASASGLLALTELGRADLAVALLVDLWDTGRAWIDAEATVSGDDMEPTADEDHPPGCRASEDERDATPGTTSSDSKVESLMRSGPLVSNEVAVLVIDSALRSRRPNAELVAAELLCRNARRLDIRQSLHWPSVIDGSWNPSFGNKTKLLLVDALVRMALTSTADQSALQSLAVRLYGISDGDGDEHVKGCLGVLICAILPQLKNAGTLMQGPREVTLGDLERAAKHAKPNPNRHMARVVQERAKDLETWGAKCQGVSYRPGALAATAGG